MAHGINDKYLGNPDDHDNPTLYIWAKLDGYEGNADILNQINQDTFYVRMRGDPSIMGYVKLWNDFPSENGTGFMFWYSADEGGTIVGFRGKHLIGVNWYSGDEGYIKLPWTVYQNEAESSNDAIVYIPFNSWD